MNELGRMETFMEIQVMPTYRREASQGAQVIFYGF